MRAARRSLPPRRHPVRDSAHRKPVKQQSSGEETHPKDGADKIDIVTRTVGKAPAHPGKPLEFLGGEAGGDCPYSPVDEMPKDCRRQRPTGGGAEGGERGTDEGRTDSAVQGERQRTAAQRERCRGPQRGKGPRGRDRPTAPSAGAAARSRAVPASARPVGELAAATPRPARVAPRWTRAVVAAGRCDRRAHRGGCGRLGRKWRCRPAQAKA
jgi:hypothetical protein